MHGSRRQTCNVVAIGSTMGGGEAAVSDGISKTIKNNCIEDIQQCKPHGEGELVVSPRSVLYRMGPTHVKPHSCLVKFGLTWLDPWPLSADRSFVEKVS